MLDWKHVKVVIFDIDGTLYCQKAFRNKIIKELISYYFFRPWKAKELRVISAFRSIREQHSGEEINDLEKLQYQWASEKTSIPENIIFNIIQKWIFEEPLRFLEPYRYEGVLEVINFLKQQGMIVTFLSDYPCVSKLQALGIPYHHTFSAVDPQINALKPNPKGLLYITKFLRVSPQECVMIGDRNEMDGEAARKANMPYLILKQHFDNYDQLLQQIHSSRYTGQNLKLAPTLT